MAQALAKQKIRIRLKGYDHQQVDKSAKDIVDTAQRTGATITGPVPLPLNQLPDFVIGRFRD